MGIFDEIAEQKIKGTVDQNEFEKIEGFGGPLDNRTYLSVPKEHWIAFHIMKNAKILPEEIELKKRIIGINSLIREELSKDARDALLTERSMLLSKLDILLENYKLR